MRGFNMRTMTILPFERKKVFYYGTGTNHNKVVQHWKNVQQICGPLYRTEEYTNKYNDTYFDIVLFFSDTKIGYHYMKSVSPYNSPKADVMMDTLRKIGFDTAENFISTLDSMIQAGKFIGNAEIEFVRQ